MYQATSKDIKQYIKRAQAEYLSAPESIFDKNSLKNLPVTFTQAIGVLNPEYVGGKPIEYWDFINAQVHDRGGESDE